MELIEEMQFLHEFGYITLEELLDVVVEDIERE